LERVAHEPLDASPREHARLEGDLRLEPAVRPPADTGVLALRVLAHEEHVHVARAAPSERAGNPRQQAAWPEVRPQVQPLADLEDHPPEGNMVGHRRIADRAEEDGVVVAQGLKRVLRHHPPVFVVVGGAPRKLGPLEREAQRIHDSPGLRDHLGPYPVAGD
jgi:hypothetical protein